MLQFAKMDAPALPIHDSFVMHHGYGDRGGLEEVMRRTYFEFRIICCIFVVSYFDYKLKYT